ncbi:MAG: hypothetical protein V1750_05125, partial [Acidobacteriota bacterium]
EGALGDAKAFLIDLLGSGLPVVVHSVLKRANGAGIAEKTLRRAKKALGVVARKEGFGASGEWCWMLPEVPKMAKEPIGGQSPSMAALGDVFVNRILDHRDSPIVDHPFPSCLSFS